MKINTFLLKHRLFLLTFGLAGTLISPAVAKIPINSGDKNQELLNEPNDISPDFRNFSNTYYLADSLSLFDPATGKGEITYHRYEYSTRQAFNNMLVRDGAVIPHIGLAQSTKDMDWSKIDLVTYSAGTSTLTGMVCLPENNQLYPLTLTKSGGNYALTNDPLKGKVSWKIMSDQQRKP